MTQLGKYELHEQLGKGGFGTVYRAIDTTLGREVALKVLHPQLMVDESFVERFKKEARTLATLEHPNIVTIYDLGETDGRVFIAMRYLPGGSLQQRLHKEKAFTYEQSLTIMKQVCEGLQVAHEQGLVHRDIKPANVLFDAKGNAVISDFGLARAVQVSGASSSMSIAGTPAYRAPELWRGKPPAFPATDVYSLGCMLVEMLTGKVLFDGETPDEIITQHLVDGPQLPKTWPDGVPDTIGAVLAEALSKDGKNRPGDAKQFFIQLEKKESIPDKKIEVQFGDKVNDSQIDINWKEKLAITGRVQELKLDLGDGVTMEFVKVPAGEFWMGSDPKVDISAQSDAQPQHRVYLDEYWIGKYPITNKQYQVFVKETNRRPPVGWNNNDFPKAKADHPVVNVSWYDAKAFCKWLSEKTMKKIGLPIEAQWEKAARGTDGRIYPWGNQAPDSILANYDSNVGDTAEVGSYPAGASPYGALDMAGNVWEWVADWYSGSYYSQSPANDPSGPVSGNERSLRGGSWGGNGYYIRSAYRRRDYPLASNNLIGFRCSLFP